MEKDTYFHIGYPKAGSTTLQKGLFSSHPDINYCGIYTGNERKEAEEENHERLIRLHKLHYLISIAGKKEYRHDEANKILSEYSSKKKDVLSNERVLSVFNAYRDIERKLLRLKNLKRNVKIIIVIRNQLEILKSQYRDIPYDPEDIERGESVNFERWFKKMDKSEEIEYLESLDYYKMTEKVEDIFEPDKVHVTCLEKSQKEMGLSEDIASFMNLSEEEKLSYDHKNVGDSRILHNIRTISRKSGISKVIEHKYKKRVKSIIKKMLMSLRYKKKKVRIPRDIKSVIDSKYRKSNKRVQNKYEFELDNYGYPI
jgi:hypothetical protein